MTTSSRILVLDFDGTVCLGDGPVFSYARLLDEALGARQFGAAPASSATPGGRTAGDPVRLGGVWTGAADDAGASAVSGAPTGSDASASAVTRMSAGLGSSASASGRILTRTGTSATTRASAAANSPAAEHGLIRTAVGLFLGEDPGAGRSLEAAEGSVVHPETLREAIDLIAGSADGYAAAERLARASGITDAQLSAAYAGSRDELASGAIETYAPEGLADLLANVPRHVQTVLVTNAPPNGVDQQLCALGLAGFFDELVTSAGKPAGTRAILERLLTVHDLAGSPERLLSVGDIWRNDLEPAAALGSVTALIERFAAPDAAPTYRASTIEQLYPAIIRWATAP
ncbi:hypothetical protein BH09ACT6_BH09ACT6_08770 [soil metagenome]